MNIGDVIEDKYELVQMLGQGGMGIVFEARHLQLDRRVALKFLRIEMAKDPNMAKRFLREARAAASIGSEHIVEVVDVGETSDGEPYMVMEYLEGTDLSKLVEQQGMFPPQRAANLVIQLCHALAAAHSKGIIHRDIKPENAIIEQRIDGTERLKVLDFGLVKFRKAAEGQTANLTATGATMGTPYYMAPEQALGQKDLDQQVDVYSTGVVLFQLLTGALPFDGETYAEILVKAATKEPLRPREVRPDLPEALEAVVLKAIAREREERFHSALELAQAIEPWAQSSETSSLVAAMPAATAVAVAAPSDPSQQIAGVAPTMAPRPPQTMAASPSLTPGGPASNPSPPAQHPMGTPPSNPYQSAPQAGGVPPSNPYQSAPQMGMPGSNPYQSAPQMGMPGSNPYQSAPQMTAPSSGRRTGLVLGLGVGIVVLAALASAGVWAFLDQSGDSETEVASVSPPPPPGATTTETPNPPQPTAAAATATPTSAADTTTDAGAATPPPEAGAEPAEEVDTAEPGSQVTPQASTTRRTRDRRSQDDEPEEPEEPEASEPVAPPPPPPEPVLVVQQQQPQPPQQQQQPAAWSPPPTTSPTPPPEPVRRPAAVAVADARTKARAGDWSGCIQALNNAQGSARVSELRIRCYHESGNTYQACQLAQRCRTRFCRRFVSSRRCR